VTVERQLTSLSSQHYSSNVTIHSGLIQYALEQQHVCAENGLVGSITDQTKFLSGCSAAINSCELSSLVCMSCRHGVINARCVEDWRVVENPSAVWVLDLSLGLGYDLIVTVDGAAHQKVRPKRYSDNFSSFILKPVLSPAVTGCF
jgi:hypothetical protein